MLDRIFMQILDMSLQASVVILVVLLARLLLKRAPKRFSYVLWMVVLFRLLCPVSIEAPISILPEIESVSESYTLENHPITVFSAGTAAYQAIGDALNGGLGVQHIHTADTNTDGLPRTVTADWYEIWILFGQYVWLAGMAGMLLCSLVAYRRLRKQLVGATPIAGNLYLADHIPSPFVLGVLKPRIYLPSDLDVREQAYIIAHEQQHIRKGDPIIKLIAYWALVLHWFNPLVWLAYFLFCKDMEMRCDEAVIQKLGENIRADYCTSLLKLATTPRSIAITPLAFGEGDTKGRIQNLSRWKKPLTWVIVVSVIVCITIALCLLTDPIGSGLGRLERITRESGYSIVRQETKVIPLTLSTETLPDSIYSAKGHTFRKGEVIAYNDDVTRIYLQSARYSNEGADQLYFCFGFSYDLPRDCGSLIYPLEISEEGYHYSPSVVDGILKTDRAHLEDAVHFRGQDGDSQIWFYVSTDALQQTQGVFSFDVRINHITYRRDGAAKDMMTDIVDTSPAGSMHISDISSESDESRLSLEVSLPGTYFPHPGHVLREKIAADWNRYDQLSQLDQYASSHLWGVVYIDADTWRECENAIGTTVFNPLEDVDWLQKTGYFGAESADPSMPVKHIKATAYATWQTDRQLSRIDIQSGYCSGDVDITLTATVCTQDSIFTTGTVVQGYATFDTAEAVTGSGIPATVVTPDRANNTGYYQDGWCDQIAYWVEGNVLYTLRVTAHQESSADMYETLQKLLEEL